MSDEAPQKAKAPDEHPLANILVNVLIPVLALSFLSKDPDLQEKLGKVARPWHLGPALGMGLALLLPIGYGIWFFIKTKKFNFFSGLGLVSVLLTGGLTLYLWNADGSVKPNAAHLFGLKEASIPFVLGITILASHWSKTPLLNTFLYSDSIFDIKRIEKEVSSKQADEPYKKLLFSSTVLFSCSFLISTVLNFFLALFFLSPKKIDYQAENALELYNGAIAKLTGWGFAVIGVPILIILSLLLFRLVGGLRKITGLTNDEIMLPR